MATQKQSFDADRCGYEDADSKGAGAGVSGLMHTTTRDDGLRKRVKLQVQWCSGVAVVRFIELGCDDCGGSSRCKFTPVRVGCRQMQIRGGLLLITGRVVGPTSYRSSTI
ncbi:SWI/SNF-related matrix-associated actin-dependent regulated protein 2 [Pyrus ussuriensis x Pyrus communis]|uniref:SWI/SNF-related matrix-associated actin-dependent regulated protein 2 n=1 Tax=Pyrus ussuriensis x Pyrus communis TaxID=2448454 RepID=A0A5N5HG17_9ROSA|nr:SWI/SNF-related matrix-associated actin-dependent regulated protein 2 [Pyrus ussuriensis x Pyrus communis]